MDRKFTVSLLGNFYEVSDSDDNLIATLSLDAVKLENQLERLLDRVYCIGRKDYESDDYED